MRYNKENQGFGKDLEPPKVRPRALVEGASQTLLWQSTIVRWLR